jgi:putative SOS response-associated peptidase YedK
MCGRMTLTRSGSEIAEYFALEMDGDAVAEMDGSPLRPRHNVAPSQPVATIIRAADGGRELGWRQWGLIPSWSKSASMGGRLFNARSETASEKPSFRTAWKHRRCLVVADGFYEWTPRKRDHQPYHFRSRAGTLLAFAGLYEEWHGEGGEVIESCTVLTTEANADLEGVHHRMPVILAPQRFERWLDATSDPQELKAMMHSAPEGTLTRQAVGRGVNNPRNDGPSCLEPIALTASAATSKETPKKTTNGEPNQPADQGELFGSRREGGE